LNKWKTINFRKRGWEEQKLTATTTYWKEIIPTQPQYRKKNKEKNKSMIKNYQIWVFVVSLIMIALFFCFFLFFVHVHVAKACGVHNGQGVEVTPTKMCSEKACGWGQFHYQDWKYRKILWKVWLVIVAKEGKGGRHLIRIDEWRLRGKGWGKWNCMLDWSSINSFCLQQWKENVGIKSKMKSHIV